MAGAETFQLENNNTTIFASTTSKVQQLTGGQHMRKSILQLSYIILFEEQMRTTTQADTQHGFDMGVFLNLIALAHKPEIREEKSAFLNL